MYKIAKTCVNSSILTITAARGSLNENVWNCYDFSPIFRTCIRRTNLSPPDCILWCRRTVWRIGRIGRTVQRLLGFHVGPHAHPGQGPLVAWWALFGPRIGPWPCLARPRTRRTLPCVPGKGSHCRRAVWRGSGSTISTIPLSQITAGFDPTPLIVW